VFINNKVGFCLGQFEVQFTVAISTVECSWLGYFRGQFTVAIRFGSILSVWRSIHFEL